MPETSRTDPIRRTGQLNMSAGGINMVRYEGGDLDHLAVVVAQSYGLPNAGP